MRRFFKYDPQAGKVIEISRGQLSHEGQKTNTDWTPFYHPGLSQVVTSRRGMEKEMKKQKVISILDNQHGLNAAGERMARAMERSKSPDFIKKADRFLKSIH